MSNENESIGKAIWDLVVAILTLVVVTTLVWFAWPFALSAFPGVVALGFVASKISWGTSLALVFVCKYLLGGGSHSTTITTNKA